MSDNPRVGRDIPEQLGRAVLVEAGHRCAVPTCKQTPIEVAHIDPWEKAREHTFVGCKADGKSLLTYPRLLQFTMKNGTTVMAEPSIINSNSDFTITWKHE